jgi:hypothetical protein
LGNRIENRLGTGVIIGEFGVGMRIDIKKGAYGGEMRRRFFASALPEPDLK